MSSNLTPIAPQCAGSAPTTLIFKEKKLSLTGDSGKVKDANGNVVFSIDAKKLTLSARRVLLDAEGREIGQLRKKKTPELHPTMYLGTVDDEKKCSVKVKGLLNITKCDADIFVGDGKVGEVSGNWRAKSFKITIDDRQVAEVSRKTSVASLALDADEYSIDIQPGVDAAFITLVTIALDELYHESG